MPNTRKQLSNFEKKLIEFDPEIERTLSRIRREKKQKAVMAEQQIQDHQLVEAVTPPRERTVSDYTIPVAGGFHSSVAAPDVDTNFELKPSLIQMVQQNQFGGSALENPNTHLSGFLSLCNTLKIRGVPRDAIRLRLFEFSLKDKAKEWLMSMPPNFFTTWENLQTAFLTKFYPPAKTARIRNEITNFYQKDGESIYEAWERYKDLQRQCPHHAVPDWQLVQSFYQGLDNISKSSVDAAAGGFLIKKTPQAALEALEQIALHNFQWSTDRGHPRRVAGIYEVDAITKLTAEVEALKRQLERQNISAVETSSCRCELCGEGHSTAD